ncbi:MAG: hypothetical protein Q9M92_03050 [Enterobacterales bacterium]|nr:hypothetical protein [Enterobacterales bacterium]
MNKVFIGIVSLLVALALYISLNQDHELKNNPIILHNVSDKIDKLDNAIPQKMEVQKTLSKQASVSKNSQVVNSKLKPQNTNYPLAEAMSAEAMQDLAKILERQNQMVSKKFTSNNEWYGVFQVDDYSEWGYHLSEKFNEKILNDKIWQERPVELLSADCRTRFCKISFRVDDDIPVKDRNFFYPDLLQNIDEANLKSAVFYDSETGELNIYAERCIDCE